MPSKVSVCLLTYNREKYIRQCLDAILSQQVDFEIVIGENKSKDNTRQLLKNIRKNILVSLIMFELVILIFYELRGYSNIKTWRANHTKNHSPQRLTI